MSRWATSCSQVMPSSTRTARKTEGSCSLCVIFGFRFLTRLTSPALHGTPPALLQPGDDLAADLVRGVDLPAQLDRRAQVHVDLVERDRGDVLRLERGAGVAVLLLIAGALGGDGLVAVRRRREAGVELTALVGL